MCETAVMLRTIIIAAAALSAFPAAAEVVQSAPGGFEVKNTVTVAAPLDRAWTVLVAPRLWWDKDHTYSDDAANLTLDERPGGCFCEKLPNKGGVEHMRVVYIQPPRMIRMVGALGPLQAEAADGTMAITLTKAGAGTNITMTYVAGGYIRAGADKIAPMVDRVLAGQLEGLKKAIESGGAPAVGPVLPPKRKAGVQAAPAATPQIVADPLAEVGATISGLEQEAPSADGTPPVVPTTPKPRPADQDSPR